VLHSTSDDSLGQRYWPVFKSASFSQGGGRGRLVRRERKRTSA